MQRIFCAKIFSIMHFLRWPMKLYIQQSFRQGSIGMALFTKAKLYDIEIFNRIIEILRFKNTPRYRAKRIYSVKASIKFEQAEFSIKSDIRISNEKKIQIEAWKNRNTGSHFGRILMINLYFSSKTCLASFMIKIRKIIFCIK